MAIDVSATKAVIKANLKTSMAAAYGQDESAYDEFAGFIADAIGAGLQHVKDDADLTGVSSGGDTVPGGVD
jgi:hypothetical protein